MNLFKNFILVNANGELNILNHPASIQFKGHDHLRESLLSEVYSAALGFSTEEVPTNTFYETYFGLYIPNISRIIFLVLYSFT